MAKKNLKKIIGSLNDHEKRHVSLILTFVQNIKSFIHETKIEKSQFCENFEIKEADYEKFINGEWEYKLSDMTALEFLWTEFKRGTFKVDILEVVNLEESK